LKTGSQRPLGRFDRTQGKSFLQWRTSDKCSHADSTRVKSFLHWGTPDGSLTFHSFSCALPCAPESCAI